jgi:hypothetical protein
MTATKQSTAQARASADHAQMVREQQDEDDMRWLMADERGRRLIWHWLGDAGIFRSSYNADALTMAFNEGQRNRGLAIQAQVMRHAPEQFILMLAEAQSPGGVRRAHIPGAQS